MQDAAQLSGLGFRPRQMKTPYPCGFLASGMSLNDAIIEQLCLLRTTPLGHLQTPYHESVASLTKDLRGQDCSSRRGSAYCFVESVLRCRIILLSLYELRSTDGVAFDPR
jgi:hypothetical protein